MGRRKGFIQEIRSNLVKAIDPLTEGRRKWILVAFLIAMIFVFGVAATFVIALAVAGMFSIVVIFRANSKWISLADGREKRKKRKNK